MDNRHLLVFDFETGGKDPNTCEIIQIGAMAYDSKSLSKRGEFKTLMKPKDFDALEDEALKVNGLTKEQLMDAPDATVMFPAFASWIQKHNINANKNSFGAPIPVTWGGDRFDMTIMDRYCKEYKYWDNKWNNGTLVNPVFTFDVMKHMWFWLRHNRECANIKLVTVLEYMGVSSEEIKRGAHDALWDVGWTAEIAIRLLKAGAFMTGMNDAGKPRLDFKDALKDVPSKATGENA